MPSPLHCASSTPARRTRDLEKARAHITVLRGKADEAWKVAEEQAAKVDKFKATAITVGSELQALSSADPEASVADDDDLYEGYMISNALRDVSGAVVTNVIDKAVAAQARLAMMRTDRHPSPRPPPSSYSTRSLSSSAILGSNIPQRGGQQAMQAAPASGADVRAR